MLSRLTLVSSLLIFFFSASIFGDELKHKKEEKVPSSSQGTMAWVIGSVVMAVAAYFGYNDYQEWKKPPPNEPTRRPARGHGHKRSSVSVSFSAGASGDGMLLPRGEPVVMQVRPILKRVAQAMPIHTGPADRLVVSQLEAGLELEITRSTRIIELMNPASETLLWERASTIEIVDEIALYVKNGTSAQSEEAIRLIRRLEEKGFKALPNSDLPC